MKSWKDNTKLFFTIVIWCLPVLVFYILDLCEWATAFKEFKLYDTLRIEQHTISTNYPCITRAVIVYGWLVMPLYSLWIIFYCSNVFVGNTHKRIGILYPVLCAGILLFIVYGFYAPFKPDETGFGVWGRIYRTSSFGSTFVTSFLWFMYYVLFIGSWQWFRQTVFRRI